MKCIKCGAEMKDGAKFCQVCGAKQEIQTQTTQVCKSCGAPLKPGAAFCTACGAKTNAAPTGQPAQAVHTAPAPKPEEAAHAAPAPKSEEAAHTAPTRETKEKANAAQASAPDAPAGKVPQQASAPKPAPKKKSYVLVIVAAVLVVCICIAAAVVLRLTVFAPKTTAAGETDAPAAVQETEPVEEVNADQIDSSDADLVADGSVSLQGTVKVSTDNRLFLSWDTPKTILLKEDDGEFVKVKDVSSAYLQNNGVDGSLWSELPIEQTVLVTGKLELDGSQLVLNAENMTDPNGNAIVTEAVQAASEEILPQSDDRLLTRQDIQGLSLQQINYAKNEIYARHGRKFDSKELQNYFNAQSWYYGTVDAAHFNENTLSDVEKKNAEFLADVEFSIAPNGYQLDQ